MEQNPDLVYVIPKEGATLFIDNLAIPKDAPNPRLAHAFLDFTLEPEIAAEICRSMRYSSPNREAWPLLPPQIRNHSAIFPPQDVMKRLELIRDLGDATVVYDRLWTEVKSGS
jgi:spermidine/putrescine-binding protein